MLILRDAIEAQEDDRLAPYGMRSRDSRGRAEPEEQHPYRTPYQRDRDRIIHTTAFRRLEYKTQVFLTTEGDYFRTRLTHTIEVAQIGRTIARALGANEDLTEAICLAHDLGHGPFGHSGESALDKLMVDHGGFDHNYQAYRIVEKIENRYDGFRGLNLTWEVKEGILKHESGVERLDVDKFAPDQRSTLEAQIVNFADDIAYTTADLDDGLRSRMIDPHQLADVEVWRMVLDELNIPINQPISDIERHRIIRRLVGKNVSDLIHATAERLDAYQVQSVDDIRRLPTNAVTRSDTMQAMDQVLRKFLFDNLYRHWRVMRMDLKVRRFVRQLFEAYLESPIILPTAVKSQIDQQGLHRTICDYIAGMTDRYALEEHYKLFSPKSDYLTFSY